MPKIDTGVKKVKIFNAKKNFPDCSNGVRRATTMFKISKPNAPPLLSVKIAKSLDKDLKLFKIEYLF